jgi:molybdate transport system substrate-binding protein
MKAALVSIAMIAVASAHAAEIKVIGSPGFREAYNELLPGFEKSTGNKVTTVWGGVNEIADRVSKGEKADVVLLPAKQIADLIAAGRLDAATRANVAKSGVGIAIAAGAPMIDATSSEAIKQALLSAKKISYSTGPSGVHIQQVIKAWGIEDRVKDKIVIPPTDTPVGQFIKQGGADIGFQQVSELIRIQGINYLGELPADIDEVTQFSAAMEKNPAAGDAARALVKYLSAPEAAAAIRRTGMDPG